MTDGDPPPPRVSVVMPCYLHEDYVAEAVGSLQAQSIVDWECVLVTDGSPDGVAEVAGSLAATDSRLKVLDTPNQGVSAARNAGVAASTGEFILPLDGDDRISVDYLEKCAAALEADPELLVVYGSGRNFGLVDGPWKQPPFSWEGLLVGNLIFNSAMYRRRDFDRCGGYDTSMTLGLEDWEFWINLLRGSERVQRIDDVTFHRRILDDSRTTRLKRSAGVVEMNRYVYWKHRDLYGEYFDDPQSLLRQNRHMNQRWEWFQSHPLRGSLALLRRAFTSQLSNRRGN